MNAPKRRETVGTGGTCLRSCGRTFVSSVYGRKHRKVLYRRVHRCTANKGSKAWARPSINPADTRSLPAPRRERAPINGVRDDNRPENLELWNTSQPSGQRVADKVRWATDILRLYTPKCSCPDRLDRGPTLDANHEALGRRDSYRGFVRFVAH